MFVRLSETVPPIFSEASRKTQVGAGYQNNPPEFFRSFPENTSRCLILGCVLVFYAPANSSSYRTEKTTPNFALRAQTSHAHVSI